MTAIPMPEPVILRTVMPDDYRLLIEVARSRIEAAREVTEEPATEAEAS